MKKSNCCALEAICYGRVAGTAQNMNIQLHSCRTKTAGCLGEFLKDICGALANSHSEAGMGKLLAFMHVRLRWMKKGCLILILNTQRIGNVLPCQYLS